MTPEQARRIAELHADGMTERGISAETGVPATSVHREIVEIKRLAAEQAEDQAAAVAEPERHDEAVLQAADGILSDEVLVLMQADESEDAERLATLQERAEASRRAMSDLEAERLARLDAGLDAAPLRERIASARMDLADSITAAERCQERLSEVRSRIAEVCRVRALAAKRAELDAAVSEDARRAADVGPVQRECVVGVEAFAEKFVAVVTAKAASGAKVAALAFEVNQLSGGEPLITVPEPPSTALSVRPSDAVPGQPAGGLLQALNAAPLGNVKAVAAGLGVACGYLPPGPPTEEELARGREWAAGMEKQAEAMKARSKAGIGADVTGVTDLDHNGREIRYRQPHPQDVYGLGYANTTGNSYGSGYRTGW